MQRGWHRPLWKISVRGENVRDPSKGREAVRTCEENLLGYVSDWQPRLWSGQARPCALLVLCEGGVTREGGWGKEEEAREGGRIPRFWTLLPLLGQPILGDALGIAAAVAGESGPDKVSLFAGSGGEDGK